MDFSDEELIIIAAVLDEEEEQNGHVVERRFWVHPAWKKRETKGEYATLYKELMDDGTKFFEYFKMSEYSFNVLLSKLEVHLKKKDTPFRKSITLREQLAVCLR